MNTDMAGQDKNSEQHWDSKYQSEEGRDRWSSSWRMSFYEWAVEHIPQSNASFVDVGSGLGYGLKHVCDRVPGWSPHGADYSDVAVAEAVIPTRKYDMINEELDESFDYVLCIQTLEHFKDPAPLVEKLLRAATKQLIITVPYREDISNHSEHEFSFDEDFFKAFGHPWIDTQYNRMKIVFGMKRSHLFLRMKNRLLRKLFGKGRG